MKIKTFKTKFEDAIRIDGKFNVIALLAIIPATSFLGGLALWDRMWFWAGLSFATAIAAAIIFVTQYLRNKDDEEEE